MIVFAWILFISAIINVILGLVQLCSGEAPAAIVTLIANGLAIWFFISYLFTTPGMPIVWLAWVLLIASILSTVISLFNETTRYSAIFSLPQIIFFVLILFVV